MTTYLQDDFETAGNTALQGRAPAVGWGGHTWQAQGGSSTAQRVTSGRVLSDPPLRRSPPPFWGFP